MKVEKQASMAQNWFKIRYGQSCIGIFKMLSFVHKSITIVGIALSGFFSDENEPLVEMLLSVISRVMVK